jgi:hypothetical protein
LLYLFKKISFLLFLLAGLSGLVTKSFAYDRVHINNYSTSSGYVEVDYFGCQRDVWPIAPAIVGRNGIQPSSSHAPASRGGCLVTKISAYFGHYVNGNGGAGIFPGMGGLPVWKGDGIEIDSYNSSGTSYVNFSIVPRSEKRFRIMSDAEIQRETQDPKNMSPGFKIWNRTNWPLSIALSQVGCLYYDTIKPGQFFDRNTGAVWFTIEANISADGKETRSNEGCILDTMDQVESVISDALQGIALGGFGVAVAAAASTTKWSLDNIKDLATTFELKLKGQYAGPPYPFRCTNKPEYEITGGWGVPTKNGNGELFIPPGTPLQIRKLANGC